MLSEITIIGNLGKDPIMRFAPSGDAVTTLNVAANKTWTNSNGEKVKQTTWFKVSVWGKMGENANQYLTKGRQVYIKGSLEPDPQTGGPKMFTRNDGTLGTSYEVRAHSVIYLSGGGGDQVDSGDTPEDDIPF